MLFKVYSNLCFALKMSCRDAIAMGSKDLLCDYIFYLIRTWLSQIDMLCQCFAILEMVIQFGNDFGCRRNYTKTPFILCVDKPLRNRSYRSRQVVYASIGYVTTPIASFGKCLASPCFTAK